MKRISRKEELFAGVELAAGAAGAAAAAGLLSPPELAGALLPLSEEALALPSPLPVEAPAAGFFDEE